MDLTEMIKQADDDWQRAQAELTAAQDQVRADAERERAAHMRVGEMQSVRDWLSARQAVEAKPETPARTKGPARKGNADTKRLGKAIPEVSQAELCYRVLESIGRPVSSKEVRDQLAGDGHDFNMSQVGDALRYLSRKKPPLAEQLEPGSGVWRLVQRPKHESSE
jgi:hypothetical protein